MLSRLTLIFLVLTSLAGCAQVDNLDSAFSEAMMRASEDQVVTEMASFAHDAGFKGRMGMVSNPLDLLETAMEFWETQSPCSTLEIIDDALVLDFGVLEDECTFHEHTYAGITTIRMEMADDQLTIVFENQGLTNGVVTIDGTVERVIVGDRHTVTAELTTTRDVSECEGRGWSQGQGRGRGQTQGQSQSQGPYDMPEDGLVTTDVSAQFEYSPLDADQGYQSGFVVDGQSTRQAHRGELAATVAGIEIVYGEMVPQAGQRVMNTPHGDTVTLTFSRIDEQTIGVHVQGPMGEREFEVDPVTGERF